MEEKLLNVSSSPHVRDHSSTKSIMRDVVIALLPAALVGIYNFRLSAVLVILINLCNLYAVRVYLAEMYETAGNDRRFQCVADRTAAGIKPSGNHSFVDVCGRWRICHYRCQADVWRTGSELYESGTGRKMFHDAVFQ